MVHEVFHFVVVNGVLVASAVLPAAPLLGQTWRRVHGKHVTAGD
jgi:hypothetical protein